MQNGHAKKETQQPSWQVAELSEIQTYTPKELTFLLNFGRQSKRSTYWIRKRIYDIVLSAITLVVLSPLLLLVTIAIRLESRGPIFFIQERMGERLRIFRIVKFRTMYHGVPDKPLPIRDKDSGELRRPFFDEDPRITKLGKFLRWSSIDELPQLLNVLRGEMSIVGPRPLTVIESVDMPMNLLLRYSVPAGLTGLAQVRDRSIAFDTKRFMPDIEYVHNLSFRNDSEIMMKTFSVLFKTRN